MIEATQEISPLIRESGFGNPVKRLLEESRRKEKFCLRNPKSLPLESRIQLKDSGIKLTIGIDKDVNPVPGIQACNPESSLPLHGAKDWQSLDIHLKINIIHSVMPVCRINNGDQKCWNLFSDISKSSDPSPSTPNKVEF